MNDDREAVQRALDMACRVLAELETKAAGYTALTIPSSLVIEIEEKRREIERLQARLAGSADAALPDTLPRRDLFFGREAEIETALAALRPEDRSWGLVIDGIGGIGKTALAVEVAHLCRERGAFEAALFATAKQTRLDPGGETPLETTPTLDALLSACARALGAIGAAQAAGAGKRRALLDALHAESGPQRRVLLILDNLETLPDADQQAAVEFMRALPPHCKGIVTSRKRTGDGAVWLRLEKLAWAAARDLIAVEAARAPNLRRCLEQAGAARWQELYDAAGGSPLALRWTLGLMRQRDLSLDRALALLSNVRADSDLLQFIYREARATMEANDWRVLSALSLFAAPARFEMLAAVAELSRLALESALERLSAYSLVDVHGPDGPYSLHPLTRRLADDERRADPRAERALQLRFARAWVEYAKKYGGEDKGAYQTYSRLEAEWPNLEAAAAALHGLLLPLPLAGEGWGEGHKEPARLLADLARALATFLWFRGYWDEGIRLATWAYEATRALEDWRAAGWRANDVAFVHYNRAETGAATAWAARCAEAMERAGGRRDRATATRLRGLVAQQREDYAEAERFYAEALAAYRDLGEEVDVAVVLNDLGEVAHAQRHYDRAEGYYREALAIDEKRGHEEHQATRHNNLGHLALDRGRPAQARPHFERALPLAREVGREDLVADAHWGLARVLEEEGRPAEALPLAEEALRIRERLRHRAMGEARELVERLRKKVGGRQ
jgi:tetratricopeptide (TPR) repeat protein